MRRLLESLVCQVEAETGQRLVLRAMHAPERNLRGRLSPRPGYLLVEYRDDTPGYFWDHDIIRELLALIRQGQRDFALYDETDKE